MKALVIASLLAASVGSRLAAAAAVELCDKTDPNAHVISATSVGATDAATVTDCTIGTATAFTLDGSGAALTVTQGSFAGLTITAQPDLAATVVVDGVTALTGDLKFAGPFAAGSAITVKNTNFGAFALDLSGDFALSGTIAVLGNTFAASGAAFALALAATQATSVDVSGNTVSLSNAAGAENASVSITLADVPFSARSVTVAANTFSGFATETVAVDVSAVSGSTSVSVSGNAFAPTAYAGPAITLSATADTTVTLESNAVTSDATAGAKMFALAFTATPAAEIAMCGNAFGAANATAADKAALQAWIDAGAADVTTIPIADCWAVTAATNATTEATNATTEATNATTEATNATTEATNATIEATNATTEATNATTEATNATTEATNATTAATNATTEATNATSESTSTLAATTETSSTATSTTAAATTETTTSTTTTTTTSTTAPTSTAPAATPAPTYAAVPAAALAFELSAETTPDNFIQLLTQKLNISTADVEVKFLGWFTQEEIDSNKAAARRLHAAATAKKFAVFGFYPKDGSDAAVAAAAADSVVAKISTDPSLVTEIGAAAAPDAIDPYAAATATKQPITSAAAAKATAVAAVLAAALSLAAVL